MGQKDTDAGGQSDRIALNYWPTMILGLLWNLMGCLNFIQQTNMPVEAMPEAYRTIIEGRPEWATAAFAVAVFGGAVGCILLLLRRRVAVPMLALSLVASVVMLAYTIARVGMQGDVLVSIGASVVVSVILLWTGYRVRERGWLR